MAIYTIEHGYRKDRRWPLVSFVILIVVTTTSYTLVSPYIKSQPQQQQSPQQIIGSQVVAPMEKSAIDAPLPWPSYGQAAYGVADDGVLAQSKKEVEAVPIASLAKVITALAVIEQKPLAPGEQGPTITLTEEDVASYREYLAKNGTVVQVEVGEKISQYQALQAMLLPSANNMSDTLARWAFGSVEAYNAYANDMLKELGFSKTFIADASGYSPDTKSTADEMVKIGLMYMRNPVLQEIAAQPKATIPFAGVIYNYNATINKDGIVGLKIGYTEAAGSTFLAADVRGGNKDRMSVVAVLGANNLSTAMKDAKTLLRSGNNGHDVLAKQKSSQ